jgi:hypothetical protein
LHRHSGSILFIIGLVLLSPVAAAAQGGQALPQIADVSSKSKRAFENPIPGINGMAEVSTGQYLIVHDPKGHKKKPPRVGLLEVDKERETAVSTPDHRRFEGKACLFERPGKRLPNTGQIG